MTGSGLFALCMAVGVIGILISDDGMFPRRAFGFAGGSTKKLLAGEHLTFGLPIGASMAK